MYILILYEGDVLKKIFVKTNKNILYKSLQCVEIHTTETKISKIHRTSAVGR